MLEFSYPWYFLCLPLPYLIYRFVPAYQTKQRAVRVPFFNVLVDVLGLKANSGATQLKAKRWQRNILIMGWFQLVIAMAQPVWLGAPQTRELSGRDLMIMLDLSGSMITADFTNQSGAKVSRLAAAKQVLADFSQARASDRLGLILFGDTAVLQAPFTSDHLVWNELLSQTQVAMVGKGTHLGDAIGLAIKTFEQEEHKTAKEKVIVVLTDGNDTNSLVPPIDAAKVASAKDIRIHVIAIGDPQTLGESSLDMAVIDTIARTTGGKSFLAMSPAELSGVHHEISALEPAVYQSFTFQTKTSFHHVPIILLILNHLSMMLFYRVQNSLQKRLGAKQGLTIKEQDNG